MYSHFCVFCLSIFPGFFIAVIRCIRKVASVLKKLMIFCTIFTKSKNVTPTKNMAYRVALFRWQISEFCMFYFYALFLRTDN